jgi:chromosome segregation protein
MAQAILTLDNSDGWLPIDYTEVEIGRRAFRSGENEYILNGQKVRLKDITELLATSGLAQRTYTIIGQGLIDQALSLRAEERRALFEEAAGINHYKSRRAETLRRLQETQRNLQRVHDILAEIRPRLTSLKRQATRAQNYVQLQADLNNLLRMWYGYKWEQAKDTLREARETAVSTENTWQASRNKLRVKQDNIDDVRRQLNRLQQRITDTQDERDNVRDELETARREVAILHERKHSIERQLADLIADFPTIEQQHKQAETDLNEALGELTTAQASMTQNQAELRQFNTDFQTKQAEINKWQTTLRQSTQQRQSAQTKLAQAEGQLSQLQERLKETEADNQEADKGEKVRIEAELEKLTAVLESAQTTRKTHREKRVAAEDERRSLIRQLKQLRRENRDDERALNKQRNNLARMETRVEMLDQMRLKEVPVDEGDGLLGNLAAFITIPAEHQTAIEAVLNNRLSTLIFADDDALWDVLDSVNGKSALTAVSLPNLQPTNNQTAPQDSAVIDWAANVITCDDNMQPLVQLLLGNTLLVSDAKAAYKLASSLPVGGTAVSPDGFIAHANGLVETSSSSNENSALAREKAWRDAQTEFEAAQTKLAEAERTVTLQQSLIQEKQDAVDELNSEERRLGNLEQEAGQRVSRAQRDTDRIKQQQEFLARQQAQHAQAVARIKSRLAEVEAAITNQKKTVADAETAVIDAEANLAKLPVAEAQQQRESLQQAINAAQTIVAGRQAVVDSRRATLNQFEGQLNRLKIREASLKKQQAEINQSDMEDKRIQLNDKLKALDARLIPQKEELAEHRKQMRKLEDETAVLQKSTHDQETIYTQTKIRFTQVKNEIEALQDRIKTDLGIVVLTYDEDQTGPTPLPIGGIEQLPQVEKLPDDIESTIQTYRAQMTRMGAINPDAPAEYEETQERFDFMNQQIEDLNQTEAQLRDIIAELDDLTSKAFAETVDKVNGVFGETFTQLFGGGAGRLVLTDPDDLTVSGVDIIARLPNRREQGLGLLSGGERSLTAAALIFSLLRVSPTPFCIMDEVDAALDEANVNRFRELLRDLSMNTQFVVITHNRGTVQVAQTIYGISMGTDSASQAISIKPEDYVKQPELV